MLAFEGTTVFAPEDLLDWVHEAIDGQTPEALLEPKTWHEALGDALSSAWGPVKHYYRDHRDGLDEVAGGRRINPRDATALAALRGAVHPLEWVTTGFTGPAARSCSVSSRARRWSPPRTSRPGRTPPPTSASSSTPTPAARGTALQIAATAARQAIMMHGIARFRALTTSPSTMAIAERLGFTEYGRNLAAYLNGTAEVVMA